jgi:hypothetical protein
MALAADASADCGNPRRKSAERRFEQGGFRLDERGV